MTDTKIYSKKSCQKILLKCTMRLLLNTSFEKENSSIDFKQYIRCILKMHNYDNESIINHLNNLGKSQINSLIVLAKKTIEKYNYTSVSEFTIDENDISGKIKSKTIVEESQTVSNDNPISGIINLLEIMKRDNLMLRF